MINRNPQLDENGVLQHLLTTEGLPALYFAAYTGYSGIICWGN